MTTHTTNHQGPRITDQRTLTVERANGDVDWQITEFDYGASYMLVATSGMTFQAHFTKTQWDLFKQMIAKEMGDE